jgi:hypothetical protein
MPVPYVNLTFDIHDHYSSEQGFEVTMSSRRAWSCRTNAATYLQYEPFTGTILLEADREFDNYTDTTVGDWTLGGPAGDWEALTGVALFDYGSCIFHKNASATRYAAETDATWDYNPATMIGLFLRRPDIANDRIDISWGSEALTLRLRAGEHPVVIFNSHEYTISEVAPLSPEQLFMKPLRMYVYFIHETMVVQSDFMKDFAWRPPRTDWEEHTWNDGSYDHVYLVGQGTWGISAAGMYAFNAVELTFHSSGHFTVPFALSYTPGVAPSTNHDWEAFPGTTIGLTLRNDDDSGAYQTGDVSGLAKVAYTSAGDTYTPIFHWLTAKWAPVEATKTGTSLSIRPTSVRELLSFYTESNTVSLEIPGDASYPSLQRMANAKVSVYVNGYQRFQGYTDEPNAFFHQGKTFYRLDLRDGMRKLQNAILIADYRADGTTVPDAVEELIKRAGVAAADISVTASAVTLPDIGTQAEPAYLFTAGTNIYEAVRNLAETWLPSWRLYCRYDGIYVFEPWTQGASEATFLQATAAPGAADPTKLIEDLQEWNDDSFLRNFITVVGMDKNGNLISSHQFDSDSWSDPNADNYVGEIRSGVYYDASLTTQDAVDTVALAIYNEVCRIRRFFQWRSRYDETLVPGAVVTLQNIGLVKLIDMDSDLYDRQAEAEYTGEFIFS